MEKDQGLGGGGGGGEEAFHKNVVYAKCHMPLWPNG